MQREDRDPACVADMLAAAQGILKALKGVSLAKYRANENLRLSIERRLEIMGEAARRVSDPLRVRYPEIPWRMLIGQRNVLIHAYDQVDDDRVWRLAETHLPRLVEQLEKLMVELTGGAAAQATGPAQR